MVGLILAGGKGQRLGRSKAAIMLSGETLLARTLRQLSPLCDRVLVSVAPGDSRSLPPFPPGLELVPDAYPGTGAIIGLASGLRAAGQSALALAVDMPFLNPEIIRRLIALAPGWDAVVPRQGGLFEPLHAVYSPDCLPALEKQIQAGQRRIALSFSRLRVRYLEDDELRGLDPSGLAFFNINTPEDLRRAEELEKNFRR